MLRYVTFVLLVCAVNTAVVTAQNHILFMGIKEEGAPASEQTFERQLRAELSSIEDLIVVDYVETQRYREITDFNRYPSASDKMLNTLVKFIPDSVMIVWGSIKSLEFKPVRKNIFGAAINGELTAGISIYNLQERAFSYNGNVVSTISVKESPVFFAPVEKVTHITASERTVLTDTLIHRVVLSSIDVIKSVLKTNIKTATNPDADSPQRSAPSISDVFTVPSVEAARIERGPAPAKKTTTPSGDTSKSTGSK